MKFVYFLALALVASGQVLPNHYIVELSNEPVALRAARQHKRFSLSDPEMSRQRDAIDREQQSVRGPIEAGGAEVLDSFRIVRNAMVVRMSPEQAKVVAGLSGVKRVTPVRMYHKVLDHALPLQKVPDAWAQIGGVEKAGAGIKIAIIDTGIDASHPGFQNDSLTPPDGFPLVNKQSDLAYTNKKVIVARSYVDPSTGRSYTARDVEGHGTAVAMIAAGVTNTGPYGPITGVAPQAWLGNYKVFPNSGGAPDSLIIRAIEDAVSDGMDVLSLSLGSFPAYRPVDDELVSAIESAVAAGKVVVIAAGNDAEDYGVNSIGSPGTSPSAITVGSTSNDRAFAGKVTRDGRDPYLAYPGDGVNSASPISGPLRDVTQFDPTGEACSDLPAGSLSGTVALILRGDCLFEVKLNVAQRAGAIAAVIYARPESPDPIDMSVGAASLPAVMVANPDGADLKSVLADGDIPVTVDFSIGPVGINPNKLSAFSSRGPSSDFSIKPDMVAVGETIYSALPTSFGSYMVGSGTSFSAPMVTGATALLMGARPGLTNTQYRSLIVNNSAVFSLDGTNPLAIQYGGAGFLNMTSSLAGTITASSVSLNFGVGDATFDQTRTVTITNVGATSDTFSITAQPVGDGPIPTLATNTVQLDPGQSTDLSVEIAGSEVAAGACQGFLLVQGTQSPAVMRLPYWYAVPTQTAKYIQILQAPTVTRVGWTADIYFRFLDANGVPVTAGIDPSIVSGEDVVAIDSDDVEVPGLFVVTVTIKADPSGTAVIHFQLGDASTDVSIQVI